MKIQDGRKEKKERKNTARQRERKKEERKNRRQMKEMERKKKSCEYVGCRCLIEKRLLVKRTRYVSGGVGAGLSREYADG